MSPKGSYNDDEPLREYLAGRDWRLTLQPNQTIFVIGKHWCDQNPNSTTEGDLHGSMSAFKEAMEVTGLVCHNDMAAMRWCGGSNFLVQMGDILDRGRNDRRVMDSLDR